MNMRSRLPVPLVLFGALFAAGAIAQTAIETDELTPAGERVEIGGPVGGPETSPFLTPGFDAGVYSKPRYGRYGDSSDRIGAANDFDFDSLLTPGARGSKRSMAGRGTDLRFDVDR
ncbi:hypothetical protein G5B40_00715 [Pikeienuella piscinae]|uniref:Uncharacterized protein n=1 Tax=Pikeienuella piscinae TaxID=2748098 RepID=A0A7L5BSU7_9RHOB|nr:hypothetical protein [Pikeienuella piscinae]QIE54092.1 hypothetical protein G5B40_00715 [Pikeienuella piscinae]